ncbi:MAG: 4Fe-4S binding protein [Lachnospiraceae bacterium]|nr:4Fe-4S binding protein [Lachnospiraceae bacterium]
MDTLKYLEYIVNEIHSTVVATVDDNGLPVTCAIDMMDYDEQGLYFLTAKGKKFYDRLMSRGYLSLTGMKGEDTMSCVAVSFGGKVREIGKERLERLFEKNSYMNEIYPNAASKAALTVFQIYEGNGEWFDLSKKPIERVGFTLGGAEDVKQGYYVTDKCIGCKLCYSKCPQKCIDISTKPVVIRQNNCLHCGNCFTICPARAIVKCGY